MKLFIYIGLFVFEFFLAGCQTSENLYIVRHAEKSTEPANDPHLSAPGIQRADALKHYLKDKNIGYIFSTETNRTVETATPLSKEVEVPIQYYSNDTLSAFLQRLITIKKNTLIVAHSNTIFPMLDRLNLQHNRTIIADNEYDDMFVITIKDAKAVKLTETKYGTSSAKK